MTAAILTIRGSPPLARGKRPEKERNHRFPGITPACAGKTPLDVLPCGLRWDHPRLRGENIRRHLHTTQDSGSPPLARGKLHKKWLRGDCDGGITPACAGKTQASVFHALTHQDHPRLRGENRHKICYVVHVLGSPPLARGKPEYNDIADKNKRITPACAGKTPSHLRLIHLYWDHPRLRGENTSFSPPADTLPGSPPLARGKLQFMFDMLIQFRITPACAGKTPCFMSPIVVFPDHPRLRGENPFFDIKA